MIDGARMRKRRSPPLCSSLGLSLDGSSTPSTERQLGEAELGEFFSEPPGGGLETARAPMGAPAAREASSMAAAAARIPLSACAAVS